MSETSHDLDVIRREMRATCLPDEAGEVAELIQVASLDRGARDAISKRAQGFIEAVRSRDDSGLMEVFLAEYGLSTREGVALMCLAEALLRVPDAETIDALIDDKIAPSDWGVHLGKSSSSLVNASTWALLLTGKMLSDGEEGLIGSLRGAVKRLGEPVIRTAVSQAMKELGRQFVLGRNIEEAMERARAMEGRGYTYSYDMLGEAARTEADARRYHLSYSDAITALAPACRSADIRANPGISVKLSALHPRYEVSQRDRVMSELVARTRSLALIAKSAGMGFNIDAEEADRLDLSLDVIEAVLSDPSLKGWDGFGVVTQAYGPRARFVIDWLYGLASRLDRRIMVRLVKGAYWDTEIKRAQVLGLDGFPVFTRKLSTDVSYIACARKLLGMTDHIYPQFATHNAHTVAAVLHMATDTSAFEFQRLHGMGEALHAHVVATHGVRCRIYAPVGAHRDLLAYLVRRLLENGANSSFVNQIVDTSVSPREIAADPIAAVEALGASVANPAIARAPFLYGDTRVNSRGLDLTDPLDLAEIEAAREPWKAHQWHVGAMIAGPVSDGTEIPIHNPARPDDVVGFLLEASAADVDTALESATAAAPAWSALPAAERAAHLRAAADLYEQNLGELFALATREAGKTLVDCVGEVREAVDFLRYYAAEAVRLDGEGSGRGVFACISPWNFPLAIFTGQIAAALAAGNAVIAKPAEQTPLIAARAVALMHEAGIPRQVLQLVPGDGATVGARLSADPRIDGLCFTGSTQTAQLINRAMAEHVSPAAPLIAETGGLNAMIVDSTALPEQVIRDVVASAFQSAGQRCSALRVLYLQRDIEARFMEMLFGAMDELRLGDPWDLSTDVGPVIDQEARTMIETHVAAYSERGRLMKRIQTPATGCFAGPAVLRVDGIQELEQEIFGPVLHVATFEATEIDDVVDRINATGYGLTFGLHTRIDDRVQQVVERIRVGNIYVNRNQIGAIVGSQPFGGECLSGTGPKAGGPHYVRRFMNTDCPRHEQASADAVDMTRVQEALRQIRQQFGVALDVVDLPGPTGESNRLSTFARGVVLCLGPGKDAALEQIHQVRAAGGAAVAVSSGATSPSASSGSQSGVAMVDGVLQADSLKRLEGFDAVMHWGTEAEQRDLRRALAARDGILVPLIVESGSRERLVIERHLCVDTTAAGGNASLLAAASR
jgi:RHH-type transcriptional regulator, proline utilization regulon repressor / proline dehydrogenase / delta 1-pyrroline-5-carboxylate dehydrogenase